MSFDWENHPEILDFPDYIMGDNQVIDLTDQLFTEGVTGSEWWDAWDDLENYLWDEYHLVLGEYWDPGEYGEWYDSVN